MQHLILLFSFIFLNSCNNDMNTHPQTNLLEAVQKNQLLFVEEELKKGANVNLTDKNGKSLLLIATHNNNFEMAKLLVSYKADVNQQDKIQDSPFLYAGAAGHLKLVQLYLSHGARFDIFNRYNGTALIPASERGHLEVVKLLANTKGFPIDHVNRLGWTALMEAVILGDGSQKFVNVIQTLIDAGCNINIADNDKKTPLAHAKAKGYSDIVQLLEKTSKK
ncbi:ankyrin repeat domain-containing protein [Sphingobacterium sp. UDSM-2020]|uniref:ankyrin repeat domain-containing protein n=1 Tax=Sphingobacterium sp. UDSM-2020 TaxID=2795738 RepID=UPI001934E54E|nr:ankyrin repeat domain-containing protein [Sphingobacterium sp. UDSM-2020]